MRVVVASQTFSGNGLAVEWPLIGLDEAEKPLARDIKLVVDGNLASMISIVFRLPQSGGRTVGSTPGT